VSVRDKDVDESGGPDADTVANAPTTDDDVPLIDAETALELAEEPPPAVGRGELIFSMILAMCGIAIVVVGELTISYGSAVGDLLGPRAFPRMVGTALTLTAGAAAVMSIRSRLKGSPPSNFGATEDEPGIPASAITAFIVIGMTFLYAATFSFLGYLLATPVYLFVTLWVLRVRRVVPLLIVCVAMPIVLYYVFAELLGVLLPAGLLRPLLVPIGWAIE
jgi:putative tricarboxylic transport membrane protein